MDFALAGSVLEDVVEPDDDPEPEEKVDDEEEEGDEVKDTPLPPEVDELPPPEPVLVALEPVIAFTALCAMLATLATSARLGVVDAELVPPLPLAALKGSRPGPVRFEWAGVD